MENIMTSVEQKETRQRKFKVSVSDSSESPLVNRNDERCILPHSNRCNQTDTRVKFQFRVHVTLFFFLLECKFGLR